MDAQRMRIEQAAQRLVDEVLWPAAISVDRSEQIPASHLAAIADAGLLGLAAPVSAGGAGFDQAAIQAVLRIVGSGCGATAFAYAQHHGTLSTLARSDNHDLRDRWLARLCGSSLAGTAFAHVRRSGAAAVEATRDGSGWRFDGHAPWATSWGMAEVFSVAATTDDGQLVWALVAGEEAPGLSASAPMDLMVFDATSTVRLAFDGLRVDASDVMAVVDLERWRGADRRAAARPNPLCLGLGDRALSELMAIEPDTGPDLSTHWRAQAAAAEVAAAAAADEGNEWTVDDIAAARTSAIFTVQRLTTALLAAAGGRGADRGAPAQLLARQALFYVVQAQNAEGRAATLAAVRAAGRSTAGDDAGAQPAR
ncbi:MAG: acyl-CoA dehydrogenase family protein [Actinomycetota bacterium]